MSHPLRNNHDLNPAGSLACGTLLSSGVGAASAALFTSVSPIGGAIFGATYFLCGKLISSICNSDAGSQTQAAKLPDMFSRYLEELLQA